MIISNPSKTATILEANAQESQEFTFNIQPPEEYNWSILNLDKLAYSVAMAESANCTRGAGARRNNCFNIMSWDKNGNRYIRYYDTPNDSYIAFKELWTRAYGGYPTYAQAVKYTGNDNAKHWLRIINHYYYE